MRIIKKWRNTILVLIFAIAVALLLWLTLISRVGKGFRHVYPPFWSYRAIFRGYWTAFVEDAGNILIFIPFGMAVALFKKYDTKSSLLVGLTVSLIIESVQWLFWLGSFEVDDLIHNTVGTVIGSALINGTTLRNRLRIDNPRKSFIVFAILVSSFVCFSLAYQNAKWAEMKELARLNNRSDGAENLLILSSEPKYLGETDFDIYYNSDGSLSIEGSSENRAWIDIGRVTLSPGNYSFCGLSGVEENTVYLELHYYDYDLNRFVELTKRVGVLEIDYFMLERNTDIRAVIGIYPDASGEYIARPAIFRED